MSFAELAKSHLEGRDYSITVVPRVHSSVAIVVPHGGIIEPGTSALARAIAGEELNLYLFEGIRQAQNAETLHLTSHLFDEPQCLALLSRCDHVLTLHGCLGPDAAVFVGGLDEPLKSRVVAAIKETGTAVHATGHRFPAVNPNNICNRGRRGVGVQVELTRPLRMAGGGSVLVEALRAVMLSV